MDTFKTSLCRVLLLIVFFTLVAIMVALGGNFFLLLSSDNFAARNVLATCFVVAALLATYCWTELKAIDNTPDGEITLVLVTVEPAPPLMTVGVRFVVEEDGEILLGKRWAPDPASVHWVDPSLN
jgi:hypothetical protein